MSTKIDLPKMGVGRYTPSSLVGRQCEPTRQRKQRRISVAGSGLRLLGKKGEDNSRVLLCAGVCGNASTTRPPG